MKNRSVVCCGLALTAVFALAGCEPSLKDNKAQYSYAIGTQIGQNLKRQNIDLDTKAFAAGVADAVAGKEPRLDEKSRMDAIREMSQGLAQEANKEAEKNLKEANDYLETNKKREGVKVTDSGLQYRVVREGGGKKPKASNTVEVHYRGRLIDGTEFDSSYARNAPATFPLDGVIKGWTEGLQLMKEGAMYEFVIPPDLAYGTRQMDQIPPNSTLIFEVELQKIVK